MKLFNKILALSLCAVAVTSCDDLDTEYLGNYVTTEQKKDALDKKPELALAGVTAMFSQYNTYESIYASHFDFGYPSLMLGMDCQGQDMGSKYSGYNWFQSWADYNECNPDGRPSNMMWALVYKNVKIANDVMATIDPATEDPELMLFLAQAYAMRAFDYFNLAQTFQFTYKGNESKPCVPIVTNLNATECATNGVPRNTVEEVYTQIINDLNEAVRLLETTNLTPERVMDSKPKRMVSLAVAYGLRARVNLVMNNWAGAAEDARAAINSFSGRPYSITEMQRPAFNNIEDQSWMWGIAVAETDRVVTSGIVNFPSHMGSLNDGYVTNGAWRWCNKLLFESIPTRDVRKGWFLDENLNSSHLTDAELEYLHQFKSKDGNVTYEFDQTNVLMPYTQVKYAPYQNVIEQGTNASDIPLMRVEEMYYIYAEATAMGGNAPAARDFLEQFVQTYRNPTYTTSASTPEALREEIWHERRIEFWGEGISWFDLMRLNKPMDRRGGAFPNAFTYNIEPGSSALLYCIPQTEITANAQISVGDNNPSSSRPTPIVD